MANEIIIAENFPASNIQEQTYLTADALSAQKVINVLNADGLAVGAYLLVGQKGGENAQLSKIDTGGITGLAITLTDNLVSKHYRNEPVWRVKANKIKVYRASNVDGSVPSDGSFTLLDTVDIQADQLYTEYTDANGGSGYWYKYTFYNSTDGAETDLSEAVATRGGNYGLYASVDEVRTEAGLTNNVWITDQQIYSKLLQAQSEVNASLSIAGYQLPLSSTPDMVKNATLLLASGYLLSMEYGPEHTGTNKDGQLKIKMARELLAKIEKGDAQLLDNTTQQAVSQSTNIGGYPDDSAESQTPSEAPMFSVTDIF